MSVTGDIIYTNALSVKKDDYLVIKEFPCKITDVTVSKTGKHGGCKCHFVGVDIFTDKKYVALHGSGETVKVPVITKNEYELCDFTKEDHDNGDITFACSLMDISGIIRDDMIVPSGELANNIIEAMKKGIVNVTVLAALGKEQIISYRIEK